MISISSRRAFPVSYTHLDVYKRQVSNIATPRLRVYRPNIANGRAVIVCGGGGYFRIQLWKESTPAAKWLQLHGYTVFELIYRLPRDGWDASAPFADAQRAMKIVRTRAADFGIAPDRIGIMGMSAGGHLAGFTALRPDQKFYDGTDRFENAPARPDFAALLFPVVQLRKPFDTTRTRREITGEHPTKAAEDAWSLDTLSLIHILSPRRYAQVRPARTTRDRASPDR